ncbi:myosin heavy chain, non-muscle isoform X2 [Tripterygium wilfordii]|uniref:myosin heavy chain, non-muscle isoform X2 n=1 Tax=Tripterygium wilfordii TaxID=458696 RepID=UPI0018F81D58|nr:myosin heavy chain, non-muscle isoform X2 [Tripterygium wilfordii]
MAMEEENQGNAAAKEPSPSCKSQASSSPSQPNPETPNALSVQKPRKLRYPTANKPFGPREFILSVAAMYCSQPLTHDDPNVWGVLTAISKIARNRRQGINILLTSDEHCFGRVVEDMNFRLPYAAVSATHCLIYRKKVASEDSSQTSSHYTSVFLKDTSTNGTYLNWEKLTKNGHEVQVNDGDIISVVAAPDHERAIAFVYRDVLRSTPVIDGTVAKRKGEDIASEGKRLKGIGIGAPEGPISLDDFRSLQRSNMQLRKQLENQVATIEKLSNENRANSELHINEIKAMKESVTRPYLDQLKELRDMLDVKQKELVELNRVLAVQKHAIEDLRERLNVSAQSCNESNEIMKSQKASIVELKAQLDEERDQRKKERDKAAIDLKGAVHRAQSEAQEELKRHSDAALKQERELQDVIKKLQESEKEWCLQVDILKPKLEETRLKLVMSDNNVRQLEKQVSEGQVASASERKRAEGLEHELESLRKELESEKAAREEAWAKVSSLELEINAAMRDLDFERRRLRAARERIMLRETQLRAFYTTTEEISLLFGKQQEQLKAMQRTLEDEENYENTSLDIDINATYMNINGTLVRENETNGCCTNTKAGYATSAQRFDRNQAVTSSDEASVTEKHDCDIRSQEECQNTQDADYTSKEHVVKGGFGSDLDGVGTAPLLEAETIGTELVLQTESPGIDDERNIDLNKSDTLVEDTMQLDDETPVHESDEQARKGVCENLNHSQSTPLENQRTVEDTETGGTIRTADLLASEVAGSWACSTAPSVHGENESPSKDNEEEGAATILHDLNCQVSESQTAPQSDPTATRWNQERRALSEMIGIVAPDLKEQFGGVVDDSDQRRENQGSSSDSDTEGCADSDDDGGYARGGSLRNAGTQDSHEAEDDTNHDAMNEDDDATQEDSLG